jgi:hypothetical protein
MRVFGHILWQEFQGDETPKLGVLSLVDDTHPAASELFKDAVVRDRSPYKQGGCAHWRECYAAIVGGSTNSEKKLPKNSTRCVFLGLRSGGQKGFRRESRKLLIPLARNSRFLLVHRVYLLRRCSDSTDRVCDVCGHRWIQAFYREISAKGVLFSMPSKKQDFGGVLAQFVDSEGAHCSVGAEAA